MRYLRADPVPDELIVRAVEGATCASSPGNCQGWDFVVVRDAPQRAQVAPSTARTINSSGTGSARR